MTLIDKAEALLPCPFCGGVAEQDYQQPYRSISAGKLGKACTIYCTECSANMVLCHEDHPGVSPDDLMAELVTAWNRRAALPARGVGVTWHPFDTAPRDGSRFLAQGGGLDAVDICSYNARVGCWDCGAVTLDDTDHEPEGYNRPAQWMPLAVLAPTDAAQAREAALREAAAVADAYAESCAGNVVVYSPPMVGANEQLRMMHEAGEVIARQVSAAIRALIGDSK